jgi:2-keto-3-deoxy-L-rhamnonate aldolase RhmA
MIEDTQAVENLESILAVPGVDVLHVASGDLGQSMGNPGREAVRELMRQVVPVIHAAGKVAGVGGNAPSDTEGVAQLVRLGARFVTISAWGLLQLGAEDFRRRVDAAV